MGLRSVEDPLGLNVWGISDIIFFGFRAFSLMEYLSNEIAAIKWITPNQIAPAYSTNINTLKFEYSCAREKLFCS